MPGIAQTQGQRHSLLGQSLLRRQNEFVDIFAERWLSAREAAAALQVNICTLRRYAKSGVLPAVRFGPRGWMRIKASAIKKFLEKGAN